LLDVETRRRHGTFAAGTSPARVTDRRHGFAAAADVAAISARQLGVERQDPPAAVARSWERL
jgi:hypothetical protein